MTKLRLILVVIMVFAITIAVAIPTTTIPLDPDGGDGSDIRTTVNCRGKNKKAGGFCPILIGGNGVGNTNDAGPDSQSDPATLERI
ncbi:11372_t:CDS:2 [Paraglomus brasilianum]|uniref:11372_t:CDS:1 n=1 Tax=Paraglomus brasilianum TaxID=144538 RepID=A0A9N9DD47_9GLOM|nr:11372_t:CDS:2 [Paraglomus brasilianum]